MAGGFGPRSQRVYEDVIEAIENETLRLGASMSERALAARGNCGLGTAHRVLTRLYEEGWLERGTHRQPSRVAGGERRTWADRVRAAIASGELATGVPADDMTPVESLSTAEHVEYLETLERDGLVESTAPFGVTHGAAALIRLQDLVVVAVQAKIRTGTIAPGIVLSDDELHRRFGRRPDVTGYARRRLRRLGLLDADDVVTIAAPTIASVQHRAARRSAGRDEAPQ